MESAILSQVRDAVLSLSRSRKSAAAPLFF